MVGDGAGRTDLQRLAERLGITDRVVFHGHVPDADLEALFATAGCLVLPSPGRSEGRSIVVTDAVGRGIPVVVARSSGPAHVIEETGCGSLFEPNDPVSLAKTVDEVLQRDAQGAYDELFPKARDRYVASRTARDFVSLWEEACC
jgi:glycosyltransferase involved in cell wall biosynthesis